EAGLLRDSRVVGHELALRGRARDRGDLVHAELGTTRLEAAFLVPEVVLERERVADPSAELAGRPLVERDRRGGEGRGRLAARGAAARDRPPRRLVDRGD